MNKYYTTQIVIALLVVSFTTKAQTETIYPKINGDTLFTSTGYPIIVGQEIKIGTGSHPNGGFEYITDGSVFNVNRLFYKDQEEASYENKVTRILAGVNAKVVEIRKTGKKKKTPKYWVRVRYGFTKYWCDIENAIKASEVVIPKT